MISPEEHKILIVDDERLNRQVLSQLLSEDNDSHILVAKNGAQALQRVNTDPDIDLILLDVMMPDMDGYEVIKQLKARNQTRDIPVIFITALDSTNDEERGLYLGASDYIAKPFHPGIVKLRVENHLRFVRQKKMLEKMAGVDSLTEIPNRRSFDDMFEMEWRRSSRNKLPLSLAMVDVDYFKLYNDNYGHARGDQVLKTVANTLKNGMRRKMDFVARYGGEEFILLFPSTALEEAKHRADIIRASVEDLAFPHEFSKTRPCVTISIGGATALWDNGPPESLLVAADEMLYQAKEKGRNRVEWRT